MVMSCKNSPERDGSSSSDGGNCLIRTCVDCGTTKTPLWRGGPAGPKVISYFLFFYFYTHFNLKIYKYVIFLFFNFD